MNRLSALMMFFFSSFLASGQDLKAIDSLEQQLPSLKGIERASVLYDLMNYYLRVDTKRAKDFLNESQGFHKNESDAGILAYALMSQGVFLSRTGKIDSGVMVLESARDAAIESKNDRALIRVNAALAHCFISSGRPARGLEYLFAALKVVERYPDREMEMKLHTNIPWAYLELKQYRKCIEYGKLALSHLENSEYGWIALYTYNNMAVSYGALGKLDSAKIFIEKGIAAAEKSSDNQALANAYFILGTIYSNSGKYDLAIQQYLKARPYRDKVGNPYFIVSDLYSVSDLYYRTGDFSKGVRAGEEALQQLKNIT